MSHHPQCPVYPHRDQIAEGHWYAGGTLDEGGKVVYPSCQCALIASVLQAAAERIEALHDSHPARNQHDGTSYRGGLTDAVAALFAEPSPQEGNKK